MANLNDLLQRLHAGQVEFVLVGGLAAVVYGVSLVTRAVDVCCRFSPENLSRLQNTLSDLNPVHRMTPQRLRLSLPPEAPGSLKNLYLSTELGVLDCLSEVLGVGNYDEVLRRSVVMELPFGECRVLDIDALIQAKVAMNRPHDQITVKQLLAIKENLN